MRIKTAIFLLGSLIIIIPLKPKLFKSKWLVLPKSNMVPGNRYIQLPQYFSGGQCDAMLKSMVSGVQLDSNGSLHNFRQVTNYHPPPVPRFPDLKGKKKGTLTPLPWACINIKQLFQSTIQHSSLVYSNSPRNVRAFRMTMMTCQPLSMPKSTCTGKQTELHSSWLQRLTWIFSLKIIMYSLFFPLNDSVKFCFRK